VLSNGQGFGSSRLALMSSIICLPLVMSMAFALCSAYVVGNGALMTSSRMLGVRPFKKNPMVSSLPMVYPACHTSSSKSDMY
jgi:hypothetical protein